MNNPKQRELSTQIYKQLLAKKKITAYKIAKQTGIDKTYLSKLSSGAIAKPGEDKLIKIAEALKIDLNYLQLVFIDPEIAIKELDLKDVDLNQPATAIKQQDWGAAPDGIVCYDRKAEIDRVKHWIDVERSRIVNLYGLGGIGKTTLAIEVVKQLKFDYLIWRDLGHISSIEVVVRDTLKLFDRTSNDDGEITQQITRLIDCLRTHRCLIVLDRVETILATSSLQTYQNAHRAYGELFRRIAESNHQSCLLLIGDEKPQDIALWEGCSSWVRSDRIKGSTTVCAQILEAKQIPESAARHDLIEAYSGHPLAIAIVATTINELFNGDVKEFLRQNTLFLGNLEFILHQQYQRLSSAEQTIIHAIAQFTKPLSLPKIEEFTPELRCSQVMAYLNSLKRRSLIEIVTTNKINCYTLQPVVRKYINSQI